MPRVSVLLVPNTTVNLRSELLAGYEATREQNAVNCWHMNEAESAALWRIYAPQAEGVVVQSTYARLVNALQASPPSPEPVSLMVGVVKYIDFDTEMIPAAPGGTAPNAFVPIIYKRRFYEYERELRAVLSPRAGTIIFEAFRQGANDGWDISLDITELIEAVYVAGPRWLVDVVRAHVPEALAERVRPSRFLESPPSQRRGFLYPAPPGWRR